MQGKDNDFYLKHNYLGEVATAGSAFLDYRNDKELTDDFSIIYGHRMSEHLMFADVAEFDSESFFREHKVGILRRGNTEIKLNVLAFAIINAYDEIYELKEFANGKNEEIWQKFAKEARFRRGRTNKKGLIMLSTCNVNSKEFRDVLLLEMQ